MYIYIYRTHQFIFTAFLSFTSVFLEWHLLFFVFCERLPVCQDVLLALLVHSANTDA
jgi:hypothetical protein